MKNKKHIPAFTMMDILTGMVVMSIVIAMVFYLFTASNKQAFDYTKVRMELNDFMLLKTDLKFQVDQADLIESLPNGFRLKSENKLLEYINEDQYLIRIDGIVQDTVCKHLNKIELKSISENEQNTLITSLELTVDLKDQKLKCHIYKDYGIREKINIQLLYGL